MGELFAAADFFKVYLAVISLVAVIACVSDKHRAKKGLYRISERTLFAISAVGGAAAMYITMCLIRHKTLHKRFMVGLPLMIIAHIIVIVFLFSKFF